MTQLLKTFLADGTFISTVQVESQGKPVWETAIFGGQQSGKDQRYGSQEEALAGHAEWVAMLEPAATALEGGVQEVIENLIQVYGDNYCSWDFDQRETDFDVAIDRLKAWAVSFAAQTKTSAADYLARASAIEEKLDEEQRILDEEYERQAKERRERIEKEGPPKAVYDEKSAMIPITADLLKSSSGTDFISEVVGRLVEERISTYNDSAVVQYRNGKMISCNPPDSALLRYIDN